MIDLIFCLDILITKPGFPFFTSFLKLCETQTPTLSTFGIQVCAEEQVTFVGPYQKLDTVDNYSIVILGNKMKGTFLSHHGYAPKSRNSQLRFL